MKSIKRTTHFIKYFTIQVVIAALFVILNGCVATKPNLSIVDENFRFKGQNYKNFLAAKAILAEISSKNELLAIELGKLPEFQDNISVKQVQALRNIKELFDVDSTILNQPFDKMYREGKPGNRKFYTPLQALFWISEKDKFSKEKNPLIDYKLESLLNKAWGIHGCILPKDEILRIRSGRVWRGDVDEIGLIISKVLRDHGYIKNIDGIFKEKIESRWRNFNEVTDRLNSPKIVFRYVKPNIFFPWKLRGTPPRSPWITFKSRKGTCASQALFVDYCLKKAGYDSVVIRYTCTPEFCGQNRGLLSYTNPTPYHWTVAYKEGGAIYELDAGRDYMGGPYKSYSEIAGANEFTFKSWHDSK